MIELYIELANLSAQIAIFVIGVLVLFELAGRRLK